MPSETTKEALSSLFPACTSVNKKRKFDPHEACVVASQQHKKKAVNPNFRGRSKALQVIVLKELSNTIPRGPLRERLKKIGRIKELFFHRIMSEAEVTSTITTGFKETSITHYKYLSANRKDNRLAVAEKQQLNGDGIIKLAGSGSLYLQQCTGSKSDHEENISELSQGELTPECTAKKEVCLHCL